MAFINLKYLIDWFTGWNCEDNIKFLCVCVCVCVCVLYDRKLKTTAVIILEQFD